MRGFSLLELVISLAVLAVVTSVAFSLFGSASTQAAFIAQQAESDAQTHLAARRLHEQLAFATSGGLVLTGSGVERRLEFTRTRIEPSDGSVSVSGTFQLSFVYAGDEQANDADDNQNGVVDEGFVMLQLPGGERIVLASHVLPASYRIDLPSERMLEVRFQTCRRFDPQATAFAQTIQDGLFPGQPGYVLTVCDETIRLRN